MKILLLDPGLRVRAGHNAALLAEFDLELRALPRLRFSAAGAAALQPAEFKGLGCAPRPLFRIDGYWRPMPQDVLDPARLSGLVESIVADLERLPLEEIDGLLMPTVYPLHLIALARVAPRLARTRLMMGFLMPVSFWVPDADACAALGRLVGEATMDLQRRCELIAYSETGVYDFGGMRADMATLLPPLAAPTARLVDTLAAAPAQRDRTLFGFFGQPFTSKGLEVIANAARALDPSRASVRFRLPPGHDALCQQLCSLSPAIEASSRDMSNDEYLRQMAEVDVVLAYYDPEHYGDKMSGVVPEAVSLGKPLAVSEACRSLVGFLDRYAPGAFISGAYQPDALAELLALPAELWRAVATKAHASSPVVRSLKGMRRYLAAGGLDTLYSQARAERADVSAAA
jgi:hypothetical protein